MDADRRSCAFTIAGKWGRPESFEGENFHWIENDAELYVAVLRRLEYRLDLLIEPGPSLARLPFRLEIVDLGAKAVLASFDLEKRTAIAFALPAGEPRIVRLRLHTGDGGAAVNGRVLNFRVFSVGVSPIPSDVIQAGVGFTLGAEWGRLEGYGDEAFRWVDNDAILDVAEDAALPLKLEIEGGPSLRDGATLVVTDEEDGRTVFESPLAGRRFVTIGDGTFALPSTLRFHVDGGGRAVEGDPRILNFRVFEYASAPDAGEA